LTREQCYDSGLKSDRVPTEPGIATGSVPRHPSERYVRKVGVTLFDLRAQEN
jgi:hypothetical protein